MDKIDWEEVARRIDSRDLPIIYMEDVHRYYIVGDIVVKALDGVSVKIYKGDFTAIMGPSGIHPDEPCWLSGYTNKRKDPH